MSGPLTGVKVVDLSGVVSGPLATMFLADQGAEVLKIEPISGDITRRSREKVDEAGEFSALFISSNRGKKSMAIDLKSEQGKSILIRLISEADVLVQNFRPGAMERLGLGADHLREQFPKLIFVSIDGVGETGPYAKKRVYDPIVQGLSGFCDIQAQAGTNKPQLIRTIVADKTTAIFTAQAVAAALYAREKTGKGDHIRVSMLDVMLSYLWPEGMMQHTIVGREKTAGDPNDRPELVFETVNGFMTVGTISDSEWQGFCRTVGDTELAADERFISPSGRSVNATARINKMAEHLKARTTEQWLELLDANDVPCGPILRRHEIVANEQIVARGLIQEIDQPRVGSVLQPKPAARFEEHAASLTVGAPRIGEHARGILGTLGYTDEQVDALVQAGAIRIPE
ncbi:acyl-CoA transferase [Sulfitobacter sp. EhC04]|uniref:CaiB/BaiF CoA transferase family protein n=1 Tax=Sulfitobacter sp. EhC04 TaxID=1849168 RepID=UPI0007F4DE98|nr:CaiB/BaiF CoA-transferase family protein [Sulfitobacter sp. EhC04]OAN75639.1 acyl-CoA transferase [Sulfitobacter sp. EhC04]